MGIVVTLRGGSGDMLKVTYDPDLNGVIAYAQLEAAKIVETIRVHNKMEASAVLISSYDTEVTAKYAVYTKVYTWTIPEDAPAGSVYRVKFWLYTHHIAYTYYGRIYKDGTPFGTDQSGNTVGGEEFTEDLAFVAGEKMELYVKSSPIDVTNVTTQKNFRVYGSKKTFPATVLAGA